MTEKRQFLRIAKKLCATFVAQIGNSAPYARVVSEADGGCVVKSIKSMPNLDPRSSRCDSLSTLLRMTCPHSRACRFGIQNSAPARKRDRGGWSPSCNATRVTEGVIGKNKGNVVKTFFSSLLIVFVTIFVAPAFAALPSGYTELEYIESSGTQYIDTGVVLKSKATVTTVGRFLSVPLGGPETIWGFLGGDTLPRWGCSIYAGYWLMNLNATTTSLAADANKHTFVNNTNGSISYESLVDGVSLYGRKEFPQPQAYTNNTLSAYIFARNNNNTAGNFSSSRIFSFNIVQDDILVINLVPCRRNSDNVVGMYDTVNNRFYTNQGTGEFTAGPVVPTIKIATTAYNSARFSPVVTDLNTTIATIRDVVTNTINQTAAIADLQATKQTRPADDYTDETNTENCPKFRQCLLVEDDNGTPHWYLIKDPVRDLVKSLRDNKINNAGETTTTAYAANGFDGANGTVDSRYYRGYVAMRKLADGSTSVYTRQFTSAMLNGTNGGQYKTLSDQEWAVTWNGNETGTANSFLPGVIYGTSRCAKTKPSSTAVGTEGWNTIENSDPVNDAENIQSYVQCYCKMTGVGVDGEFTPVRDSSRAPWVFDFTRGSAAPCATYCAYDCAYDVRFNASFRSAVLGWAVE